MRISKESYDKIVSKINDLENKIVNFNEKHYPAGSSKGGQFAPKGAGGSSSGGESKGGAKDSKKAAEEAEKAVKDIIDSLDEASVGDKDKLAELEMDFNVANLAYAKASLIDRYGSKPKIEKRQDEDGDYYRVDMPNYRGARGVEYGTERLAQKGGYGWEDGIAMSDGKLKATRIEKDPFNSKLYDVYDSQGGLLSRGSSHDKMESRAYAKAFNIATELMSEIMSNYREKFNRKKSQLRGEK